MRLPSGILMQLGRMWSDGNIEEYIDRNLPNVKGISQRTAEL